MLLYEVLNFVSHYWLAIMVTVVAVSVCSTNTRVRYPPAKISAGFGSHSLHHFFASISQCSGPYCIENLLLAISLPRISRGQTYLALAVISDIWYSNRRTTSQPKFFAKICWQETRYVVSQTPYCGTRSLHTMTSTTLKQMSRSPRSIQHGCTASVTRAPCLL